MIVMIHRIVIAFAMEYGMRGLLFGECGFYQNPLMRRELVCR